ncbi:hypothetical protein Pmar_PMAR027925 [Perkinsus marinus ATCC 50983]|uniref:Uncharacterized protein n=1 Tax=Perkinsus marinus (strain ATCC 50983 / TXsc) TaxID=423536 RepID=C5LDF3_PERM5|nr:hypothetical protein Pmar_PMAR027925 [Perkinsus marinus ATCC 50983]EER05285.1 hypothetical protein Pmar_PMAR027925 [Perkinsus marinus ATCC 50983]|eukprot:XP_002773469.1 hypothetical protein Pmar_PMAR027925 [Perkinsus marinus ATCC 50983]
MEAMGPSTTTTTTTTAPTRAMVNIPAVGQADLTVPGIQSRSDTSPTSAESGDGPARFVIIGGAGSMNQFDMSPTGGQWDFEQEPNRAAASLRLCIWAMFLFACMVMFRVQQDKLAQAMANRRSNVLHLMAPWEKASFNDRNSTELRAVYIDPRLATVASNLRLGQNHELDVTKLLPPRSNSYIRELDSQRLVASVLDGPWRSTTYSNDDNESVEQAASDDVAMLQSIDKNLYAANKGVSDLCPSGDKRSCMMALLKDKHQKGSSCFHLAASPDGGIAAFDVAKNDTAVCLGSEEGVEIRALLPDRFSNRAVYVWRPAADDDEEEDSGASVDCVTTVDTITGQCIDSVPVHPASYYAMDFREESAQKGKGSSPTTKLVSVTYDYQRWQAVLRSYVVGGSEGKPPVSSAPEFKSVLFTSRGPFWVLDSPEVSDGFVILVAGTEPQIGILHAAPLYDAQIGPASNQWMKQGDVLRRENTRSAYYRHVSSKMVDDSVSEIQQQKSKCSCQALPAH